MSRRRRLVSSNCPAGYLNRFARPRDKSGRAARSGWTLELAMTYSETDLRAASAAGVLDAAQLARLLDFLQQRTPTDAAPAPRLDVAHLLWYAGALIVITAMGLFSTLAFSQMGGSVLAIIAV